MHHLNRWLFAVAMLSLMLGTASCESDKDPSVQSNRTVSMESGVAGGTIEDKAVVNVTVSAIDPKTRDITLATNDGKKVTFTAGPEIRNFDQIHQGDKVEATIIQRMTVFVKSGNEDPTATHAAALARAPKGAQPGAIVAETFEVTATVKAIDTTNRTASLQFVDGTVRNVPVRSDVDLTRYHVGDTVVMRVQSSLGIIVEKP